MSHICAFCKISAKARLIARRQRRSRVCPEVARMLPHRASSHKLVDNSLAALRAFPPSRHDRRVPREFNYLAVRTTRPGEDNARRTSPEEDPAILDDVRIRAREFPDFSHVSDERIKRDPMDTVLATCQRSPQSGYLLPNRVLSEL